MSEGTGTAATSRLPAGDSAGLGFPVNVVRKRWELGVRAGRLVSAFAGRAVECGLGRFVAGRFRRMRCRAVSSFVPGSGDQWPPPVLIVDVPPYRGLEPFVH